MSNMGAARKANKHLPSNLVFEKRGKKRNDAHEAIVKESRVAHNLLTG